MRSLLRRFVRNKRANVATIFALAAIPIVFLTGMGVDYGMAADRQARLNAFADAAALAAVTPTKMAQSTDNSVAAATATFNAQASSLQGITYNPASLNVSVSIANAVRTVTVNYTATYTNLFPSVLGSSTITLKGSSTATAGMAPNINFYLLLDDSPSMAIAATQSGIDTLIANTQGQCTSLPPSPSCGCAFGCHETNPAGETHCVPKTCDKWGHCTAASCNVSGLGNVGGVDNYALAQSLGVSLRIDLVRQAVKSLVSTANATAGSNHASYGMAIYTFDLDLNNNPPVQKLTAINSGNVASIQSAADGITLMQVYVNNYIKKNQYNNDTDTDLDTALSKMNSKELAAPGSGTNTKGDTPQEVLFIVTDGVNDKDPSSTPAIAAAYGSYCCSNSRQQSTLNPLNSSGTEAATNWCTAIKNRGIRIAILYTEYLPIPNDAWYSSWIAQFQNNIAPRLEDCASPGLYFQVTTGDDITAALAAMFQAAVQSAYLAK